MKHQFEISDANIRVDLPTQDLERLVDKITDSIITITTVVTIAAIIKFHLTR